MTQQPKRYALKGLNDMKFDLLGDWFGKARRRKIEAAAARIITGGSKPVAVDYGVLGTKIATAATAYLLTQTLNHTLPATGGGILTGVGAAIMAAGPSALQSSGVFRALSPNTVSAITGLGQTVSAVLAAPQNARNAAFEAAVEKQVQISLEKTGQFTTGSAPGNLAPAPATLVPFPAPATEPEAAPEAAVGAETALPRLAPAQASTPAPEKAAASEAALTAGSTLTANSIQLTGGNQ